MLELKINVTKKHIEQAKYCGYDTSKYFNKNKKPLIAKNITTNCAIALACQEIFPLCDVNGAGIGNISRRFENIDNENWHLELPKKAEIFMIKFDSYNPETRLTLEPIYFNIQISDEVLNIILKENGFNLKEISYIIDQSETLELTQFL